MSEPDIHFAATPDRVIVEMLRLGDVGPDSVVYDLGCGDGRTLIAAAQDRGAHGVGIDLDPVRIAECRTNAAQAGVQDRLTFLQSNFFDADISKATTILLYLLDSINVRLRPRILAECRPGVRVLSYSFEMGDWEADAHTPMAANGVFLWIVPAHIAGVWSSSATSDPAALELLTLQQTYQRLSGLARINGRSAKIIEGRLVGEQFTMRVESEAGKNDTTIQGKRIGQRLEGTLRQDSIETPFAMDQAAGEPAAI
jgi:SAM-dependent methyltransferase